MSKRQPTPWLSRPILPRVAMYEAGIGWEIRAKTYYWRLSDAVFETCRNSRKLFNIPVLNVATVDALGVIISIRGALLHGKDYHIGVGSNVVYSTGIRQCESLDAWNGQQDSSRFFMSYKIKIGSVVSQTFGNHLLMTVEKNISRGGEAPPCIGLISDVLPEVQGYNVAKDSQTGVSTQSTQVGTTYERCLMVNKDAPRWYALRTTYGREKKAYDYMTAKNVKAFYPTITTTKLVHGKRKQVIESRIPNLFFAYGTEDEIKSFVYDNHNLPFLRFYYRYFSVNGKKEKSPMIVPDRQMESLRIICEAEAEDILVSADIGARKKFEEGQIVRIIDGKFKGVVGRVAKYKGQLRVGVVIEGMTTVATAYVPKGFLEEMK